MNVDWLYVFDQDNKMTAEEIEGIVSISNTLRVRWNEDTLASTSKKRSRKKKRKPKNKTSKKKSKKGTKTKQADPLPSFPPPSPTPFTRLDDFVLALLAWFQKKEERLALSTPIVHFRSVQDHLTKSEQHQQILQDRHERMITKRKKMEIQYDQAIARHMVTHPR